MAIIISLLALLATFYQLHLQRVHNEKSLKPLAQIDLMDREKRLYVHIQNSGVGPLVIEKLAFSKNGTTSHSIKDYISLNPRVYQHILITEATKKVIMAGSHLEIFSTLFGEGDTEEDIENARKQLAEIKLKVDGRDIYNNKVTIERSLDWFLRHHV